MYRKFRSLMLALTGTLLVGCYGTPVPDVRADRFIFYSIMPYGTPKEQLGTPEFVDDHLVLGKIEIKDTKTREAVVSAFREGSPGGDGPFASCFFPRHAITTYVAGKRVDYVICFECGQYRTIRGGSAVVKGISSLPTDKFNDILTKAGVKLAPPPGAVGEL